MHCDGGTGFAPRDVTRMDDAPFAMPAFAAEVELAIACSRELRAEIHQPAHGVLAAKPQEYSPELRQPCRVRRIAADQMVFECVAFHEREATHEACKSTLSFQPFDQRQVGIETVKGHIERPEGERPSFLRICGCPQSWGSFEIACELSQLAMPLVEQALDPCCCASALQLPKSLAEMPIQLVLIDVEHGRVSQ